MENYKSQSRTCAGQHWTCLKVSLHLQYVLAAVSSCRGGRGRILNFFEARIMLRRASWVGCISRGTPFRVSACRMGDSEKGDPNCLHHHVSSPDPVPHAFQYPHCWIASHPQPLRMSARCLPSPTRLAIANIAPQTPYTPAVNHTSTPWPSPRPPLALPTYVSPLPQLRLELVY